jgi:rod shape-determining protein MreD
MSYKKAAFLYGIGFFVQFSLLNLFSVNGVTPNLILCLMIFITYKYNNGLKPALLAIPFALLSDVIGGQYVGVSALALFVLCLAVSYFGRDLNRETIWTLLTVSAIGTVVYYFIYWLILKILGNPGTILDLMKFLLISVPANMITVSIAFFVFTQVFRRRLRPTGYGIVNLSTKTNKRNNKINLRNLR